MPLYMGTPIYKPRNYLVWSILNAIFCSLPFGIAAIVFSSMTRDANDIGDFNAASKNSKRALIFNVIALVIGLISFILLFIFIVILIIGSYYASDKTSNNSLLIFNRIEDYQKFRKSNGISSINFNLNRE